jgi:hypothetical protein
LDSLETLTVHTLLEDELEFFNYVLEDSDVRIIPSQVGLTGPKSLTLEDIAQIRKTGSPSQRSLLLWKTSCPNSLCWSLYTYWYNADWVQIEQSASHRFRPRDPSPWQSVRSAEQSRIMHTTFWRKPLSDALFMHGKISEGLSPIISIDLPKDNHDFMSMTADFYEVFSNDVWLEWDPYSRRWKHQCTKALELYGTVQEQPIEFIQWQQRLFDWVRSRWGKWIIPRFTYRLGSDSPSLERMGQHLANLLGKNVIGFDPQPPVISPRDQEIDGEDPPKQTA